MDKTVRLIFVIVITFFWSCGSKPEVEIPDDILEKEKFKQILTEFHLLESYVEDQYSNGDTALAVFKKLELELYEKHQLNQADYLRSYNFYLKNPYKLMDPIYEEIVNDLSKMEARTKGQVKK